MTESLKIDFELEEDGRWIAEAVNIPGVLAYGSTRQEALAKVSALAREISENALTKR